MTPGERLEIALQLFDLGIDMLRTRLRREQPGADDEEIERQVRRWLRHRPGAEHGDAEGRVVPWPREP
jgi:hypothetical protein